MRLVTIANFTTPTEAQIARGALEAAGIVAFLEGENSVGALWHLGNAMGWIKLQVAEDNVEAARRVLGRAEEGASPLPESDGSTRGDADENEPPTATASGDAEAWRALQAAVFGLLICPPLLFVYSAWLLLKLAMADRALSAAGKRVFLVAMLIDLIGVGVFTCFLSHELGFWPSPLG